MMGIRLAGFDDLPAILAISNWAAINTAANFALEPEPIESWQEEWRQTHELYPHLVAVDDSNIVVGFAKAAPWKGRCAYTYSAEVTVYVDPDHHGQGIGKALYAQLIRIPNDSRAFHGCHASSAKR